ncbi:hypothetical protein ACTQV0_05200 [Selenomonas montiformis]
MAGKREKTGEKWKVKALGRALFKFIDEGQDNRYGFLPLFSV